MKPDFVEWPFNAWARAASVMVRVSSVIGNSSALVSHLGRVDKNGQAPLALRARKKLCWPVLCIFPIVELMTLEFSRIRSPARLRSGDGAVVLVCASPPPRKCNCPAPSRPRPSVRSPSPPRPPAREKAAPRKAGPPPAPKVPSEDTLIGRPLMQNGRAGAIEFKRNGKDLQIVRLKMAGDQISRQGEVCEVDLVDASIALAQRPAGPPASPASRSICPACPFSHRHSRGRSARGDRWQGLRVQGRRLPCRSGRPVGTAGQRNRSAARQGYRGRAPARRADHAGQFQGLARHRERRPRPDHPHRARAGGLFLAARGIVPQLCARGAARLLRAGRDRGPRVGDRRPCPAARARDGRRRRRREKPRKR